MATDFPPQNSNTSVYHTSVGAVFPGTLMERMGMSVIEHSAEKTIVTMPVEGNTQRVGILHGGASAALAETAGSLAASAAIADENHIAVGVDLNISHLRMVREGTIRAEAEAEHLGSSSAVHVIRIFDDSDRLVATARMTNRIIEKR